MPSALARRNARSPFVVLVLFSATALADPPAAPPAESHSDLLDRAIAERTTSPAERTDAAALRDEGDRLTQQRRFDEAIATYERAYRLDPADQDGYLRLLLAKQAAGRLSDADRDALTLIRKSRELRIDEVIRGAQLNIVQAREALRSGETSLVHAKVGEARAALGRLPRDVDVAIYGRELDRLTSAARRKASREEKSARARETSGDTAASGDATTAGANAAGQGGRPREAIRAGDMVPPASMQANDEPAGRRETAGASSDRADPLADADRELGGIDRDGDGDTDIVDRALASGRYEPDGRLIVPDRWSEHPDRDEFNRYQSDLDFSIRTSRASWYFGARAGLAAPRDEGLVYPADWAERTARRAEHADGEIYRGPAQRTEDGQEYYTAIYDLAELLHPVPNFYGTEPSNYLRLQSALDREWLRRRSMIFGGWAPDLAAGTPLLQFYGGIDNWAVSPRYDADELERILRVIDGTIGK